MRAHVAGMLPFGAKGEDESKENNNKHDWKHTEYRLQQIIDRPPRRVTLWSILGDSLYFLFLKFTFLYRYMGRESSMAFSGLIGGMASIGYICLLLMLVLYTYAVTGVIFFGDNDPFHFGSLSVAIITLVRVTILDAWTTILYINYHGCSSYNGGYYYSDFSELSDDEQVLSTLDGGLMRCSDKDNAAQPLFALFYFVSYIFVASFCVLALIIGAVGMAMFDAMHEIKEEEAHKTEEAIANDMVSDGPKDRKTRKALEYLKLAMRGHRLSLRSGKGLSFKVLFEYFFITNENYDALEVLRKRLGGGSLTSLHNLYIIMCDTCASIADDATFNFFINLVICYVSIMAGLETVPSIDKGYAPAKPVIEMFVTLLFTIEVIVKIAAEDESHILYFKDSWNWLDFIVVVFSWASFLPSNLVMMIRMIRLLRVLKLMRTMPELQNMAEAMLDGVVNVLSIGVILFVYLAVSALIGESLFGKNDPHRFGTVADGMITMFQCSTFDAWADALYTNAYGCEAYGFNEWGCDNPEPKFNEAVCYFCANLVIGGLVMLTLFVGVMSISLEDRHSALTANLESEKELVALQEHFGLKNSDVNKYRRIFQFIDISDSQRIEEIELLVAIHIAGVDKDQHVRMWNVLRRRDYDDGIDFATFLKYMMLLREEHLHRKYGIWHPVQFGDSDIEEEELDEEGIWHPVEVFEEDSTVVGHVELSPAFKFKRAIGLIA